MKPGTEEFKKHRAEYMRKKRAEGKYIYEPKDKKTEFSEILVDEYFKNLLERCNIKLENIEKILNKTR